MTAIISDHYRISSAKAFVDSFATNNVYMGLGKVSPWTASTQYPSASDSNPPAPDGSVSGLSATYREMFGAKKVQSADASLGIPRWDWTYGQVYIPYDSSDNALFTKKFYVLTTDLNIYKCISNNRGATSTVMPTGTSTTTTTTSDGYIWKFMGAVTNINANKFLTPQYIPVKLAQTGDGSAQLNTQDTAIAGAILSCKVLNVGSGYTSTPTLTINGDGTGATATAVMNANTIVDVIMTNVGSGYSYATVTIAGGSGSGASIQANISPNGGHGKNILYELGAYYSMIYSSFQYGESGAISTTNDFRTITLFQNPNQFGTSTAYTASTARMTTRLTLASVSGFVLDEKVIGASSGASGNIVEIDATNKYLYLTNLQKTFTATEVITGQTSASTSTVSIINNPAIAFNSGQIIYTENRSPTSRNTDQVEEFIVTVEY